MKTRIAKIIAGLSLGLTYLVTQGDNPPAAQLLLAKYSQALDSLRSINLKAEITTQYDYEFAQNWDDPLLRGVQERGTKASRAEYRTDGRRFHSRVYEWGRIGRVHGTVPADKPYYQCRNWDGKQFYQHTRTVNEPKLPGSVNLSSPPPGRYRLWPRNPPWAYLMGYNLASDERLDAILQRAKTLSVRPARETVGRVDCYVLDAVTANGRFRLWLDPEHGYHAAKVETKLVAGDLMYDIRLTPGQVMVTRLENVTFREVNGAWVPGASDVYLDKDWGGRGNRVHDQYHVTASEIVLNPDHAKLNSFGSPIAIPANDPELRDGTFVYQEGARTKSTWQNGLIVPDSPRPARR